MHEGSQLNLCLLVTSAVHVTRHYRVQIPCFKVKQESSVSIVPLHAHQSVENHLNTQKWLCKQSKPASSPPGCMCVSIRRGWAPPTWLRCSIEFDSLPVFSSRGRVFSSRVLRLPFCGLWIWTRAVTSILPFKPNLGDHTFSSISASSMTLTVAESWHLLGALLLAGLGS